MLNAEMKRRCVTEEIASTKPADPTTKAPEPQLTSSLATGSIAVGQK